MELEDVDATSDEELLDEEEACMELFTSNKVNTRENIPGNFIFHEHYRGKADPLSTRIIVTCLFIGQSSTKVLSKAQQLNQEISLYRFSHGQGVRLNSLTKRNRYTDFLTVRVCDSPA